MVLYHLTVIAICFTVRSANSAVVLWLKWWAESADSSKSASIRNLYLFIVITMINIVLYFVYLASVELADVGVLTLIGCTGILHYGSHLN
jgi:ATP-binding cassette subfamily C (CFTR/MRP) protein 1